jgi:hypothetical protein
MTQGQWSDQSSVEPYNSDRFRYWNPPGCMLHDYGSQDLSACLRHKKILFVGDSTTRQLFWAAARKLDRNGATREMIRAAKHTDLTFERNHAILEFVWDPFMNSSKLDHELAVLKDGRGMVTATGEFLFERSLIVIGAGLWHARNFGEDYFDIFKDSVDHIAAEAESLTKEQFIPPRLRREWKNPVLFAPVQTPNYGNLSPSRTGTILPSKIKQMNDYLLGLSRNRGIEVLQSFGLMTQNQPYAYGESGLHVVENVANRRADIILNMRCNSEATIDRYPYSKTCCNTSPSYGVVQFILIAIAVLAPMMMIFTRTTFWKRRYPSDLQPLSTSQPVTALSLLLFAVTCCYFTDRTKLFEKAHIVPFEKLFLFASGVIFFAGLLSVDESSPNTGDDSAIQLTSPTRSNISPNVFLPKVQADEWKGWMLAILLIAHYTGASKILWVYEIIRLFVPSYLFIAAFSHTEYFYQTGDYSLRRVGLVLVRLNILNWFLMYIMKTTLIAYYFPFLLSFWFMVIYFTMRVGRGENTSTLFVVGKILLACALTSGGILTPGILDTIVGVLRTTCNVNWNVDEVRHMLSLDMFVAYIGMIISVLSSNVNSASNGPRDNFVTRLICRYFGLLRAILVVASLILLPGNWIITRRSPDAEDYDWWQPYIGFIPVLAFAILRNSLAVLRTVHSTLFAWIGRSFMEIYILHFHIWLAADRTGLLRLGLFDDSWEPWGQVFELIATSVFFIWVSWGVSNATNTLVSKIIDVDIRQRARISSLSRVDSNDGRGDIRPPHRYSSTLPTSMKNLATTLKKTGSGRFDGKDWTWNAEDMNPTEKALRLRLGLMVSLIWVLNWLCEPLPSNVPC